MKSEEKKFKYIPKSLWDRMVSYAQHLFDLSEDKDNSKDVTMAIERSVEFRGTNLWILIFAILVCSLGLNINSTAVIIGAMLISPLLGPIMGLGLGVATYDFELVKRAFRNFGVAVGISILASAIYFFISPLSEAQSELLARTTPNIYDVFVALFGGLAGIVAFTRKDKNSTVIPGVAIATALMPPICTAGYGLATFQFNYFFGALYLFFINSVFISLSAFLILRFLKFPLKTFIDPTREKRVRQYIIVLVTVTVIPSLYLGVGIIQRSYFESNANAFISKEMDFPNSQIVSREILFDKKNPKIKVTYVGEYIEDRMIVHAKSKLGEYSLSNTELLVRQGFKQDELNTDAIKTGVLEDLFLRSEKEMESMRQELRDMDKEIAFYRADQSKASEVKREVMRMYPVVKQLGLSKQLLFAEQDVKPDTVYVAQIILSKPINEQDRDRLAGYLETRLPTYPVEMIIKIGE
jgi:uncharacterized hydrophobic protein (TIGR00271 family)